MKNLLRKGEYGRGIGYKFMPYPENRDNKDVLNISSGSSGYRGTTVRFPSKKRSKRVWKKFYALFPGIKVDKNRI